MSRRTAEAVDVDPVWDVLDEETFQQQVVNEAVADGWAWHHHPKTAAARRWPGGWPDLSLVHPAGYLVLAELKTMRGKLNPKQRQCLAMLGLIESLLASPRFRVVVWRPRDMPEIERTLRIDES